MPPARGDHDARRRDVSEAVWAVLAEHGFHGLTLRAVAARLGASTGLVTHYFPGKRELIAHALDILEVRAHQRPRRAAPAAGLPALRTAILNILPMTPQDTAMNRIWVSSWDVALADPEFGAAQARRYDRVRAELRTRIEDAQRLGHLSPDDDPQELAVRVLAFTHGLVVQALFDPGAFPPDRQGQLVDAFLATLRARVPAIRIVPR